MHLLPRNNDARKSFTQNAVEKSFHEEVVFTDEQRGRNFEHASDKLKTAYCFTS